MITDSIAVICDARVLAVLSTIITLFYLVIKFGSWLADSFHVLPNKTQGPKGTPVADRNQDTQSTTTRNQCGTESQLTDTGHQTLQNDNGLRVRTATTWAKAEYIETNAPHSRGIQECGVLRPQKRR